MAYVMFFHDLEDWRRGRVEWGEEGVGRGEGGEGVGRGQKPYT